MKKILFVLATFSLSLSSYSQIEISEYSRKINCQVDATYDIEAPKASSKCGEVKMASSEALFSGGCLGTLVRTYTYTDNCGNTATAEQYITLTDNLAPELIGVPANISVKKSAVPLASKVSARDNCGQDVKVEFAEHQVGKMMIRVWTSEDPCGNVATGTQQITLLD